LDKINYMKENYYIGLLSKDSLEGKNNGWVVGKFMERGVRKSDQLEVKYWEFKKGDTGHKLKISRTIEFTYIIEGEVQGIVDGEEIIFKKGEYIVIKPEIENNVTQLALSDIKGITIKAPSDPSAKKEIE